MKLRMTTLTGANAPMNWIINGMSRVQKSLLMALILLLAIVGAGSMIGSELIDSALNKVLVTPGTPSERAKQLHKTLVIVDLHADSLMWNRDLLIRNNRGHVDVPRLQDGNVAIQAFTIVTQVPRELNITRNSANSDDITLLAMVQLWPMSTWFSLKERALYQARKLHDLANRSHGRLTVIRSTEDLDAFLQRRVKNPSMIAAILGVEGAHCLEGDLNNIDVFYESGIRMMAPTHFFDNDIGGSAHGVLKGGLTEKGKKMVRRMQAKSMIVDLAHASHAVIKDVLAISTKPVVVSHTGVRGTCNNDRNLTDAEVKAIAKTGGVIGIGYWRTAVCGNDATAIARAIRYTADLVGVDHVALGSDYDGATTVPFDTAHLVMVTDALIARGFTDEEIRKIMGENTLRVLREGLPK